MLCAGMVLAACSNEDGVNAPQVIDKGEMANLAIDLSGFTKTRAIDEEYDLTGQEKETFTTLQVMIVDNSGVILKNDFIESLSNLNEYKKVYGKVKATSSNVYVVANLSTAISVTPETTTLTTVKDAVYAAQDQQTRGSIIMEGIGSIDKATLISSGNLADNKDADYDAALNTYQAAVEISPIVARMQIKKISAKSDSKVTFFKVGGIYMNKTYKNMALDLEGTDFLSYSSTGSDYTAANFGVFAIESGFENDNIPSGKCAAFNYFAEACTADTPKAAPHIIVKLTDITYEDGFNGLAEGWLTIQSYSEAPTSRNTVYTIDDIQFGESNIGPNPYQTVANIQAAVTVKAWSAVTITPNLD